MTEFDMYQRARLAYTRFQWLAIVSGASIVFLTAFVDTLRDFQASVTLLVLALVGLAFTLFVSIGVQIVASAADRWGANTVSPILLVWEWRLVVLAHVAYLVSILLLVTYLLNNVQLANPAL